MSSSSSGVQFSPYLELRDCGEDEHEDGGEEEEGAHDHQNLAPMNI